MRVGLLANLYRPDAVKAARETAVWLRARGVASFSDGEGGHALGVDPLPAAEFARVDLMVTFGGDGTLIRASHVCAESGTPILGVFYGRFGFVTQIRPDESRAAIRQFLDGEYQLDERMMVQTDLVREGRVVASLHSLNEAVVQRAATTRMLTFRVSVDGKELANYPADGVMVSTPTGSTAYALSAGGPVIDPAMDALLFTAVMPHTLSARPLVVRPSATIEIGVETRGDAVLSCDGQGRLHMLSGDVVRVTRSARRTRLVSVDRDDFLDKLAARLQWSRGRETEEP